VSRRSLVTVLVVMATFIAILVGAQFLLGNLATSDSDSFRAITGIEPQNPVIVYEAGCVIQSTRWGEDRRHADFRRTDFATQRNLR